MRFFKTSVLALGLLGMILWAYWPTLGDMAERWSDDPQYSHGYVVPLFSIYLLWSRRKMVRDQAIAPSWWGLAFLFVGLGLRATGVLYFYGFFDSISLLFCLAGAALIVGGFRALRWSWSAILFLGFMTPLPFQLQVALGSFLQQIATQISTFSLQTLGVPAINEGNIILFHDVKLGVVEACNGLGMLVTFFAISTGFAILLDPKKGWWRPWVVIAGAIPIAIIANVCRITVTGLFYAASKNETARFFFHDGAGLMMMALAVLMIFVELHIMDRLIVDQNIASRHESVFYFHDVGMPRLSAP